MYFVGLRISVVVFRPGTSWLHDTAPLPSYFTASVRYWCTGKL
jgi:hypothetical protein